MRVDKSPELQLHGAAFKILMALRKHLPVGSPRKISQSEIAQLAGVSESTVSNAMRDSLDGVYLRRSIVLVGKKRAYQIELLPPPSEGRRIITPTRTFSEELRELIVALNEGLISHEEYDNLRNATLARQLQVSQVNQP